MGDRREARVAAKRRGRRAIARRAGQERRSRRASDGSRGVRSHALLYLRETCRKLFSKFALWNVCKPTKQRCSSDFCLQLFLLALASQLSLKIRQPTV